MQFAINYSRPAAELLQNGVIMPDRFKCPNWDWLVEEARAVAPVYVHYDLRAGDGSVRERDWDAIFRLLRKTDTQYVNLHPDVRPRDFGLRRQPDHDGERERIVDAVVEDVALAVHRAGAGRVIVENLPYRQEKRAADRLVDAATDAAILARVIRATGVGLLLDLAHATLTADALGLDVREYVLTLPLDRLREVHVTGIGLVEGVPRDHLPMTEDAYELLAWLLQRVAAGEARQPEMIAFEYGGIGEKFDWRTDPAAIEAGAVRLRAMIDAFGSA